MKAQRLLRVKTTRMQLNPVPVATSTKETCPSRIYRFHLLCRKGCPSKPCRQLAPVQVLAIRGVPIAETGTRAAVHGRWRNRCNAAAVLRWWTGRHLRWLLPLWLLLSLQRAMLLRLLAVRGEGVWQVRCGRGRVNVWGVIDFCIRSGALARCNRLRRCML